MNLFIPNLFIVFVFMISFSLSAGEVSRHVLSMDRIDRLMAMSEVVVRVKVLSIAPIGKPTRDDDGRVNYDLFIYGRLVTLELLESYQSNSQDIPIKFYLFQKGIGGLSQANLKSGEEYIIFLKIGEPPEIIKKKIKTSPPLPTNSYYAIFEERNGVFAKSNIAVFSMIDAEIRKKIKEKKSSKPLPPIK